MSARHPCAAPLVLALVAVSALTGCSSPAPRPAPAIVLHLATDDPQGQGLVSEIEITSFAKRVRNLSHGTLTVDVKWNVNNDPSHDWDQAAAQRVIDGDLELGVIPSRAFDLLGVTSMQALSTPMLITDDALADTVAGSDLVPQLMAGLDTVGLTGLGMIPESLRHPFDRRGAGYVSPSQFVGATTLAPHSAATDLLFATLGGRTVDDDSSDTVKDGQETDYGRGPEGIGTGDVVWFAKFNVVVANSKALAKLSPTQRGWLRQAADDARVDAVTARPSDAEAARMWCDTNGIIVAAGPAGVAAFAAAVAPARAKLASDPATAEVIDGIQALKDASTPIPPVTACPSG